MTTMRKLGAMGLIVLALNLSDGPVPHDAGSRCPSVGESTSIFRGSDNDGPIQPSVPQFAGRLGQ
ncbi:MAG: hypothetical protein ACLQK4_12790 [Acidimicrobiales bacterium]